MRVTIGVDPGSGDSGYVVIVEGHIASAGNKDTDFIINLTKSYPREDVMVVIEDMRPYNGQLSPQTLEACKNIGEMRYRLKSARIACTFIPRSEVKKYLFDRFTELCYGWVAEKISKKGFLNKNGEPRKPSYVYVDDRIVVKAMKEQWGIETPKPGRKNSLGISTHAWQALAVASTYLGLNHQCP